MLGGTRIVPTDGGGASFDSVPTADREEHGQSTPQSAVPKKEEKVESTFELVSRVVNAIAARVVRSIGIEDDGGPRTNGTIFAFLEGHALFQNTTLLVIVINACWICVDVEKNHPKLPKVDGREPLAPWSNVMEQIFCIYFSVELIIRFLAFRRKVFCVKDAWFVFDSTLVLLMVIETWLMPLIAVIVGDNDKEGGPLSSLSSLRLLRLLRLTRMARIMKYFPELMTLVKGVAKALQAVFFILLFLLVVMYVFAIIFTSKFGEPPTESAGGDAESEEDTAADLFGDLGSSMMTLFTNGVLGDNLAEVLDVVKNGSLPMMWLFILFMVISGMTLLNMLIGVLCAVIEESAHEETEKNQVAVIKASFEQAFRTIDSSNDGMISEEEWKKMKHHPLVRMNLANVGVEEKEMDTRLDQIQEMFFGFDTTEEGEKEKKAGITYTEFVEKVAGVRWDTPASTLDLEILKELVKHEDKLLKKKLGAIEAHLTKRPASASQTPGVQEEHNGRPAAGPEPAAGDAGSGGGEPPMWLREVPTELLLEVLQTRASSL